MMNRTFFVLSIALFALLFSSTAAAQVPAVVPVQGILNDANGDPVEGDTPITFTLYDDAGDSAWSETFSVSVDNGFFAVGLGSGNTALDLTIFSTNSSMELGIKVGSDAEMSPRMQLGTVPYAARAAWSDEALDAMALQGQTLADLDARFLQDAAGTVGATNLAQGAVTSATIADGTITSSDISNPVSLYEVSALHCENEVGTLMTKDWCYARQDNAGNCSNTCSGLTPVRRRQCEGSCGCGPLFLCQVGQPCNPRAGWPRCTNQPLAGYGLPSP